MDSLGDRMSRYEEVTRLKLTPRSCCIIRCDGRAFHTFTKGFERPFDLGFVNAMSAAAKYTAEEMQGFRLGYTQSDEVSFFLTDFDKVQTQGWFGYDLCKVVSVSASILTSHFNRIYPVYMYAQKRGGRLATFDSRAFTIPIADVANYFLWRAQDWERNSLSMYARSFFSVKELYGKSKADVHEMLHSIGENWTEDVSEQLRNGLFFTKSSGRTDVLPRFSDILALVTETISDTSVEEKSE